MFFREFIPTGAAALLASRYWTLRVGVQVEAGFGHRVIPDGCTDLVVVQRGGRTFLTVRGPRDTPLVIPVEPGDRFCGARLWPDAGALVTGVPAAQLAGVVCPGAALFGDEAGRLAATVASADEDALPAVWDAWLAERLPPDPGIDVAVRLAIVAINAAHGGVSTAQVAAAVALSPRQLQRRFRDATGLTIKTYARIRRLRASLAHLLDGTPRSWSQVAAALGFADQPHLISEFTRLAGARPGDVARYIAGIRLADVVA